MEPYQSRIIEEKYQLDDKTDKLAQFIGSEAFKNLDKQNQSLLSIQHHAMIQYSMILSVRISLFQ